MIRLARAEDIPDIQRVRHSVHENRLTSWTISDADVLDAISVTGRGWVAEVDGEVVGFAIANLQTGNVWALFVDPAHERRGHGRELHDTMLDCLLSQGLRRPWLTTERGTRAQGFYQRAGWEHVGFTEDGEVRFEYRSTVE